MPTAELEEKEHKKSVKQPEQRALFNQDITSLRPKITVFGIGGAGGNAVNNMIRSKLEGVDFVVANTDSQALANSLASTKIQLGPSITQGLGAGSRPEVGKASAEEAEGEVMECLKGSNMAFITAGMGGGTGTGAAPVVAKMARDQGILTIGVVTKPFHFEGIHRMRTAEKGIDELQQFVDTLIVIPNQNLFRVANEKTTFADAFRMADDVLYSGVRGVTDLMVMPGLINLDFADIRTVMSEMGKAMMGTGDASGERRALDAAEAAISNPLLDDVSMKGARGVLINITGGYDMTLYEVDEAANRIREEVDSEANIIFGSAFDESMFGNMRVSVVATGIDVSDTQRAALEIPTSLFGNSIDNAAPAVDSDDKDAESENAADKELKKPEQTDLENVPEKHSEEKGLLSFFDKWRSKRSKNVPKNDTNVAAPSPKSESNQALEVDELDIPAFLRRK
ncbi:MAG: cell division protein FtsZ [Holosporales bacterium]|jgi:cell division protein FtsZ|nr:cell division protein FtsZ [Holosporales bacterium]